MNIFRFEMKALRASVLGWCASLCAVLALYLSMYPLFRSTDFDVAALYARFPETLQALFGMANLDVSKMTGFLAFPLKLVQELLAIGGFVVGAHLAAHDTREKSADFLYSKPVSRKKIFTSKLMAAFAVGVILLLMQGIALRVLTDVLSPGAVGWRNLLASALISILLFWLYAAAGIAVGTRWPNIRGTAGIGLCSMFFFHIVFSVCKVATKDAGALIVRILVPVAMFDRELAAGQGLIEWPFLLLWLCELGAILAVCWHTAKHRDLAAE